MQYIMKYRFIVALLMCCGIFLIASIANTVKKQMDQNATTQEMNVIKTCNSVSTDKMQPFDTTSGTMHDTLFLEGKDWRTRNEIHIMY